MVAITAASKKTLRFIIDLFKKLIKRHLPSFVLLRANSACIFSFSVLDIG